MKSQVLNTLAIIFLIVAIVAGVTFIAGLAVGSVGFVLCGLFTMFVSGVVSVELNEAA